MIRALLVGNPNCGKTTLFNALTGQHQQVGNWPGVTVEKKVGFFNLSQTQVEITDLPGIYSLVSSQEEASQDEQIAAKAIGLFENAAVESAHADTPSPPYDCIINVIDACHFERHFYLTSQLLELGVPVIIVLNMMDLAKNIQIRTEQLSQIVQCPVVALQANKGIGVDTLKQTLNQPLRAPKALPLNFSETDLIQLNNDLDLAMADARYTAIHQLTRQIQSKSSDKINQTTAKIDKIVLNRYLAFPLFFSLMYSLFFLAIHIGGALQDYFAISSETLFVQWPAKLMQQMHWPDWLITCLAHGAGLGISTTLTFIPVLAVMYFCLSFLESCGYMARVAFIVDKAMHFLGLPGKAFVPLIIGFGCNVPAVMAARTLNSERERLLTILMSPFMSCSARLAIYAVFVAAFFPHNGAFIIFSLYCIGIFMAILTGLVLKKTLLKGPSVPLIIELPIYHRPLFSRLLKDTTYRLRLFIMRAGKIIVPVSTVLGLLNMSAGDETILAWLGHHFVSLFTPMGLSTDNWPAAVGLITGVLAKEVVIGTLNNLYTTGNFSFTLYDSLMQQFTSAVSAYAYLLFILLYIPCVSTIAAIRQEANRQLMWFSIFWSTLIAYGAATLFYQLATITQHPQQTMIWIFIFTGIIGMTFRLLRTKVMRTEKSYAIAAS